MKTMNTKLAIGILMAAAGQGVANADSLAYANLTLSNFIWSDATTGAALSATNLNIIAGNNTANVSASYQGMGLIGNGQSVSVASGGQLPVQSACNGPGCATISGSTGTPPPAAAPATPSTSLASALTSLTGAIIDIPSAGVTAGATATAITMSELTTNSTLANSTGTVGTLTTTLFSPTLTELTALNFNYNIQGVAKVINPASVADTAYAAINWSIGIQQAIASATCSALTQSGCIWTTVFSQAPGALNTTASVTGLGTNTLAGSQTGTFLGLVGAGNNTVQLLAGDLYKVTIGHQINTSATRDVVNAPEPALLTLLGMGLLGFGLQKRKQFKMMA